MSATTLDRRSFLEGAALLLAAAALPRPARAAPRKLRLLHEPLLVDGLLEGELLVMAKDFKWSGTPGLVRLMPGGRLRGCELTSELQLEAERAVYPDAWLADKERWTRIAGVHAYEVDDAAVESCHVHHLPAVGVYFQKCRRFALRDSLLERVGIPWSGNYAPEFLNLETTIERVTCRNSWGWKEFQTGKSRYFYGDDGGDGWVLGDLGTGYLGAGSRLSELTLVGEGFASLKIVCPQELRIDHALMGSMMLQGLVWPPGKALTFPFPKLPPSSALVENCTFDPHVAPNGIGFRQNTLQLSWPASYRFRGCTIFVPDQAPLCAAQLDSGAHGDFRGCHFVSRGEPRWLLLTNSYPALTGPGSVNEDFWDVNTFKVIA